MGNSMSLIIPDVITDFFDIVLLILNAIKDTILGAIALAYTIAAEGVKLLPLLFDMIDLILDFIFFSLEMIQEYSIVPMIILMLIPFYIMMYLLINRLNNLLG